MDYEEYQHIARFYDEIADEYSERVRGEAHTPFPVVIPEILQAVGVNQVESSVLDLACGTGLLKTFTHFSSYTGVDVSEAMLEQASQQGYDMLIHADVLTVLAGLPSKSFDGVVMVSAAYFLSPHVVSQLVIEMRRVAKKFVLLTFDGITEVLAEQYRTNGSIDTYNHIGFPLPEGMERFTRSGWKAETGEEIPVEYCFGLLE